LNNGRIEVVFVTTTGIIAFADWIGQSGSGSFALPLRK
jgi:hypothetical protein